MKMKFTLRAFAIFLQLSLFANKWCFVDSFIKHQHKRTLLQTNRIQVASTISTSASISSSTSSLLKKGKLKYINALIEEMKSQGEEHQINKFLNTGELPPGILTPLDFYSTMNHGTGSVSVIAEYTKKATTGFIIGMPPPEIIGGVLRDAGAKCIAANMEERVGGVSADEFQRLCREQTKSRITMAGTMPVLWSEIILDKVQIWNAASSGAAAITLHPSLLDQATFSSFLTELKKFRMEAVIMVKTLEEAQYAVEQGARVICLYNKDDKEIIRQKHALEKLYPQQGLLYVARIAPEQEFSIYYEIDLAWILRDEGFHVVWPSPESIYVSGMTDIYPAITAFKSKASKEFLSPRQFLMDRRSEGATEFLGDILY